MTGNTMAEPVEARGTPDAWLYGDDYVVLVESKVGDAPLRQTQMDRHFQKLCGGVSQPRRTTKTWADVHRFFSGVAARLEDDSRDKWIIGQFTQYLEWQGMNDFTGFTEEAFSLFDAQDNDPNKIGFVRGQMEAFGDMVLDGLGSIDSSFYKAREVGNFYKSLPEFSPEEDHFWVAFGPSIPEYREKAHQTVSLYGYGVDVFANVELKAAIEKLRKKAAGDWQDFVEIISGLPEPFTVRIEDRRKRQVQLFDYIPVAELRGWACQRYGNFGMKVNDPVSASFQYLKGLLLDEDKIKLPSLSVRKIIGRNRVLELSEGDVDVLVKEVVDIMKAFHPLVEFVNG
jgi:hypothetical protein